MNFAALSVFGTFFGPWLVGVLRTPSRLAAAAYIVAGLSGILGGYLGGRLTDRLGPRLPILLGATLQLGFSLLLLVPGIGIGTACTVLVGLTFLQPLRGVAQRVALAAARPTAEREAVFSSYRLVINVGSLAGPLLGAAFVGLGWRWLHAEVAALYLLSFVFALRTPNGARTEADSRTSRAVGTFSDWRLYALLLATTTAWTVMYTYETVLPIVLTQSYGISPSLWGLVYSAGPALVIVFQLRVTRWLSAAPAYGRLAAGTMLMGMAFLVLGVGGGLWAVLILSLVFLTGDMIWGPASEDVALRLAPSGQGATYMGVLTSGIWLGSAIAPAVGLPLRERFGDMTLWGTVFGVGLLSGVIYVITDFLATRSAQRRPRRG